jgi:hypothetical protein
VSRWTGVAVQVVMFPAAHGLVPWALFLVATRHEWTAERPSLTNLAGLIPVAAGFYLFAAPTGWLIEKTPHCPNSCVTAY